MFSRASGAIVRRAPLGATHHHVRVRARRREGEKEDDPYKEKGIGDLEDERFEDDDGMCVRVFVFACERVCVSMCTLAYARKTDPSQNHTRTLQCHI